MYSEICLYLQSATVGGGTDAVSPDHRGGQRLQTRIEAIGVVAVRMNIATKCSHVLSNTKLGDLAAHPLVDDR